MGIAIVMPGGAEWIIIAVIGMLLFSKQLPELGRMVREAIDEFMKRWKR